MLSNLQKKIADAKSGLTLSFSVNGLQISPELLQSQACVLPDLIADARAQAQKLADSAGLPLGAIVAISGFTASTTNGTNYISPYYYSPPCQATIKFGLGH